MAGRDRDRARSLRAAGLEPLSRNGSDLRVLNTTLSKETVAYECDANDCRAEKIGPVTIPSIGLEGAF